VITPRRLALTLLSAALAVLTIAPTAAQAENFGFLPGTAGFDVTATNQGGTPDLQAGSHPYEFTTAFHLNTFEHTGNGVTEERPFEDIKDAHAELPPGLVGNPQAVPECSQEDFTTPLLGPANFEQAGCPPATSIGTVAIYLPAPRYVNIYNLAPPPGVPAQFGFNFASVPVVLEPSLRTGGDYGFDIDSADTNQSLRISGVAVTLWGVPAAAGHDGVRGDCLSSLTGESVGATCPAGVPARPFLTLPTSCQGPTTTRIEVDSWQNPGAFIPDSALSHEGAGEPIGLSGCNQPDFSPTIRVKAESSVADSPSGLQVDLHLPQSENPNGLAEADLRDAVVKLPVGLTVNPSSANGLGTCSQVQIELAGPNPATCPDNSKIGSVEIDTPLLDHPLDGSVYLAAQGANKFGSLLAIYIAVDDPQSGVVVKLAGKVEADPQTGQLTTTFSDNPQIPFEDLKLEFFGGARAALRTPTACGPYSTTIDLTPWTSPARVDAGPGDSFQVTSTPGGGCPSARPFKPTLSAGSTNPLAGAYSPFVLKLTRADGEGEINSLTANLPAGLLAKLKGVPYCSDAQIAQTASRSQPGQGGLEQSSPSCPAASQVGTVNVGAGAGTQPVYVQGKAYLAGPYRGAPLSLAIITPAVAGPFDLGTVVVRTALYVNEYSAQVRAVSDQIPSILAGIPLDVRSIALQLNRPNFTLNPTNCEAKEITGTVTSTLGQAVGVKNNFAVGACNALGFKPGLKLSLTGQTKRAGHPALKAVMTYPKGGAYANIARAQVSLPGSEFLDQGNLNKVCKQAELTAGNCPKTAIYGKVKAWTPLEEAPLTGNVYLGVGFGYKLPALVAELNGQIRVLLKGKIDTDKEKGIRSTFEAVPDAPVSRFVLEMKGGKKYGLLENSTNICKNPGKAEARFTAQNGKVETLQPTIANSCGKGKKKQSGSTRRASK
jgi:hypothetical protein